MQRGTVLGGVPVDREIEWPTAAPDHERLDELDEPSRRAIVSAALPVLLPANRWLERVFVTSGEHWVAIAFLREGLTLNLQASVRARVYPGIGAAELPHSVRGTAALVTSNEGIVSASWIENGVAYSLELECDEQARESCRDTDELLDVAEQLHYAGGAGPQ